MKDYSYFLPGYTGFCPYLSEHFGQTYGHATRHIIQRNPHLEDRLAPVHYRPRRYEKINSTLEKYLSKERDKYEYPKWKHQTDHLDACEMKHRKECKVGYADERFYHLDLIDYEDGDRHRGRCYTGCESVYPPKEKYTSSCTHGDKIRKSDHEHTYPKYVFIQGFAECVQPEIWISKERRKLPHEHHPRVAIPCPHAREHVQDHYTLAKKCPMAMPNIHMEDYHPAYCGHQKVAKFDINRKMRKEQVKPHRYGGVIPKYTGYIPGMLFSFGESYGPVSDRLLQKHHDRMREIKIK